LPNLVDNYNETPHSSLRNYTPDQVYDDLEYQQETFNQLSKYNNKLDDKIDLDVGDRVRKRVDKGKFDKENAKFSSEIYIVYEKVGRKYLIIDEQGNEQPRKYKYFELLKVEPNKVEGKASGLDKIEKAKKAHRKKTKVDRQHKMIDVVDSVITKRKVIEIPAAPPKETKKKEKRKVDVIDGETHVEIDKFVDSKFKDGSLQYLVKWKNEPNTNNLWIPAKQLVQDLSSDAFRRFRNALKETKKN
jgi:hypothetical protein